MERIVKTPGVCGGNACVRDTRVPVWTLQRLRELGASNRQLLDDFPSLTAEDLPAAWAYVAGHEDEIRHAIARQGPNGSRTRGRKTAESPRAPVCLRPRMKQRER